MESTRKQGGADGPRSGCCRGIGIADTGASTTTEAGAVSPGFDFLGLGSNLIRSFRAPMGQWAEDLGRVAIITGTRRLLAALESFV